MKQVSNNVSPDRQEKQKMIMKYLLSLMFILFLPIDISAQDVKTVDAISIDKSKLVGRWLEVTRRVIKGGKINLKYSHTYIFKEGMCHRGEVTPGAILFNVTGKYEIADDSISIRYFDLLTEKTEGQRYDLLQLRLKVIALADDEINAYVREDSGYEYYIRLKKSELY